MGLGSFVKKATRKVVNKTSQLAGDITTDITGSDALGQAIGGSVQQGLSLGTLDLKGAMSGTRDIIGGSLGLVGELVGGGEEEAQTPEQVAATSQSKEIDKKKKELEGALFMNTAGTRQQSVLNPR